MTPRNFCHPQGKPRVYFMRGWWYCKLVMPSGTVVGTGKGKRVHTAYNAFVRDKRFRERFPNHRNNILRKAGVYIPR